MSLNDVKGEHRINAAGGRSTASVSATAAPSDPPKIHDPLRIHVLSRVEIRTRSAGVACQAVFGRVAAITAVPAIVEEQDTEAVACERLGKRRPLRAIARVAVEDEYGGTARARRANEPGAQAHLVFRLEAHLIGGGQDGRHGGTGAVDGK